MKCIECIAYNELNEYCVAKGLKVYCEVEHRFDCDEYVDKSKAKPVEEVCIWEKTYDKVGHRFHYNLKCSSGLKLSETMYSKIWASFTYCPYCGKPIKIKE
jgi:hypothetical protein